MTPTAAANALINAFRLHDASAVIEVSAPDVKLFAPELRESTGGTALAGWVDELQRQFPGFSVECRRILVARSAAAVDCVLHSSAIGDLRLMGVELPAREAQVTQPMLITMWLSGGKVSALRAYYDRLRVLEELGIFGDVKAAGVIDLPPIDGLVDDRPPTTDPRLSGAIYRLMNEGSVEGYVAKHAALSQYVAPVGDYPGRAGVRDYMDGFYVAFSAVRVRGVGDVMAGNMVASEWRLEARQTGDIKFPGGSIPATGNPFALHGASLLVANAGMIDSHRLYYDRLEMVGDLGLVPA
jgi:hypothetical protein